MSWKRGQVFVSDLRLKTVTLVKAAERLGDPFLQNLYLMALTHIEEQVKANRQKMGREPKSAEENAESRHVAKQAAAKVARGQE